ncbi:uncharacterized protein TNCT_411581 [Trichonephila clavata]|uniref:Uncharacterized protein n=1 Tax=Trichonephila clavata TaxID=2740835 RepID=A0A8X6KKT0_TRICU|nr:uncharacterized protein TNCT_411581 [Trichonephila clavata]
MPDSRETTHMDDSSNPVNFAPIPILTYQLPRSLCIFLGDDQHDIYKWLKDFERIATSNRWNEQLCLANDIFFLTLDYVQKLTK